MEYVLVFLIGTVISWIGLLIVIPIAQKLADFAMPPWGEALWKLGVVAGVGNAVAVALDPVNTWLSWLVGLVVFFAFMVKWFEVDFFGALVIVMVTWIVRAFLVAFVMGLFAGGA